MADLTRPHVFTTDGYVHAHMLGSINCTTCGEKYANGPHIIEGGPTDRRQRAEAEHVRYDSEEFDYSGCVVCDANGDTRGWPCPTVRARRNENR
jgi:hypothetical protein